MPRLKPVQSTLRDDTGALAVITVVTAVVIWFAGVTPDTTTRIVSTVLAGLLAFVGAALGLSLVGS